MTIFRGVCSFNMTEVIFHGNDICREPLTLADFIQEIWNVHEFSIISQKFTTEAADVAGIILCMHPANERWRCIVTPDGVAL